MIQPVDPNPGAIPRDDEPRRLGEEISRLALQAVELRHRGLHLEADRTSIEVAEHMERFRRF